MDESYSSAAKAWLNGSVNPIMETGVAPGANTAPRGCASHGDNPLHVAESSMPHQQISVVPDLALLQDVVAGDGTTSVTVICGALLKKCLELLERGVHATVVSDAFAKAAAKAIEVSTSQVVVWNEKIT